jgi:hypothetical protein
MDNLATVQEIKSKKQWHPSQDRDPANGINWQKDPQYPGFLFYWGEEKEVVKTLIKLGRNDPYSPAGNDVDSGQADYFKYHKRKILGLALKPCKTTMEGQVTKEFLDLDRVASIRYEGQERLQQGRPYHKNPPPHKLSELAAGETDCGSGNNREHDFYNKYPSEHMLVIIVGPVEDVHPDASVELTEHLAKTNANPKSANRQPTIDDHIETIITGFTLDPRVVNKDSGEAYNPDKIPLSELTSDHPVWIKCFRYLCGAHVQHVGTRTRIFNGATGNTSGRGIKVTEETKYYDINHYGYETAIQRDEDDHIVEGWKRSPWYEHFDLKKKMLILVKDCSGTHFDSVIYPFIERFIHDEDFEQECKAKIKGLVIHANCSKPSSEKSLLASHKSITNKILKGNVILRKLELPTVKFVIFPQQWKTIPRKKVDITKLEKQNLN